MSKLFVLHAGGIPASKDLDWKPENLAVLATEPRRDLPLLSQIEVNGAWRTNRWYVTQCCKEAACIYIGWTVDGEWFYRWKCPICESESMTMYPGWRPPKPPSRFGGQQKQATAARRGKAGY